MPEKAYVLGHPVAHSKSPVMHNAAYRALGLPWTYAAVDCPTETEARVFLHVRDWRACNITMPWKPLAFEVADRRTEEAVLACGANVLVNWAGRLHADNTDGKGCVAYLERCGVGFSGVAVAVCGTGPTSLAILHACAKAGARRAVLFGRDAGRAQRVLNAYRDRVGHALPDTEFAARCYGAEGDPDLAGADVIVDATPLGMHESDPAPFDTALLSAGQTVFDVVYGHGETALVAAARAAGCATFDGTGMLVAQAVETLRDIAEVTGAFAIPSHLDVFGIMAQAAGFDLA